MMNEYREEFSLQVALKREEGWTRCAPMHPETDNSRGSVRGPTSFQKYVRESCGGSAVKYGGVSSPPCCVLYTRSFYSVYV
jgi:hypothetical protein